MHIFHCFRLASTPLIAAISLAVNLLDTSRSSMNCCNGNSNRQQHPSSNICTAATSQIAHSALRQGFLVVFFPFLFASFLQCLFVFADESICKCVRNYSSNLLLRQLLPAFQCVLPSHSHTPAISLPLAFLPS